MARCLIFLASTVLTGCVSAYKVPASLPTAELSVVATAVPGSTTSRAVTIAAIAEQCGPSPYGAEVAHSFKNGSPETVTAGPAPIAANGPFHFGVGYLDSGFAQNRSCMVRANFQPVAGRKYKGILTLKGEVTSCDLTLYDVTDGKEELAQLEMPPTLCLTQGNVPIPNGRSTQTDWSVQVQTTPSK